MLLLFSLPHSFSVSFFFPSLSLRPAATASFGEREHRRPLFLPDFFSLLPTLLTLALAAPAAPPSSSPGKEAEVAGPDYSWTSSSRRSLALELVRVTEAAALSGARWLGKGDKNAAGGKMEEEEEEERKYLSFFFLLLSLFSLSIDLFFFSLLLSTLNYRQGRRRRHAQGAQHDPDGRRDRHWRR